MLKANTYNKIVELSKKQDQLTSSEAEELIKLIKKVFDDAMLTQYPEREIRRLTTKFRDAGRRSAPWKPASSRVPGRPQDGADGNRINRWSLPKDHKFYANETTACLVEIKYYLQALSFKNSPRVDNKEFRDAFTWLIGSSVEPGAYVDPIQLIPIDMNEVIADAKIIQSGHIFPLDRGGKHEPSNTFLMLARSNQIQGNMTINEMLDLLKDILDRHKSKSIN